MKNEIIENIKKLIKINPEETIEINPIKLMRERLFSRHFYFSLFSLVFNFYALPLPANIFLPAVLYSENLHWQANPV